VHDNVRERGREKERERGREKEEGGEEREKEEREKERREERKEEDVFFLLVILSKGSGGCAQMPFKRKSHDEELFHADWFVVFLQRTKKENYFSQMITPQINMQCVRGQRPGALSPRIAPTPQGEKLYEVRGAIQVYGNNTHATR